MKAEPSLPRAKSRGLTCTLVTGAINAERTWDEIKLCNSQHSHLHLVLQ